MKVRIDYTTDVDDDYRRAINLYYGKPGLATRKEVQNWIERYGSSEDDNLMHDLQKARERGDEPEDPPRR
jgi:hypothetical protein